MQNYRSTHSLILENKNFIKILAGVPSEKHNYKRKEQTRKLAITKMKRNYYFITPTLKLITQMCLRILVHHLTIARFEVFRWASESTRYRKRHGLSLCETKGRTQQRGAT